MSKRNKRRGQPPNPTDQTIPLRSIPEEGYPLLSFRHLQPQFRAEKMSQRQCSEFLIKWAKRSHYTWKELNIHKRHALGFEMLPRKRIKPKPPEFLQQDSYMVFRHEGNLPFVGFKAGDVFYVLWVEVKYGDLYDHG